jgi:hypothetical protein
MSVGRFLQQAAAGAGEAVYVDDVFSTYLYTGNGTTQTITNGIDLSGEGGLVWTKSRENTSGGATAHAWIDTERGKTKWLSSSFTSAEATNANLITAFNSNGYTVGSGGPYWTNDNGYDYASWTFRKQPGFFDVVTYTGDDTAGRTVSHNLGSVPGMIIVKRTDTTGNWVVYHRGQNGGTNPEQYRLLLNSTSAESASTIWNNTAPTSTEFTVTNSATVNALGGTYVAYLFAHDAQDFGTNSDESIIKCGSYTGNGSTTGPVVDLGFEPQWLLIKKAGTGTEGNWLIYDSMRGLVSSGNDFHLLANTSAAESNDDRVDLTPTGFKITSTTWEVNSSGADYIYVAIRRPHKPAEEFAATDLFDVDGYTGTAGTLDPAIQFPFDTDMFMLKRRNATGDMNVLSRLVEYPTTGGNVALSGLVTSSTAAEADTWTFRSSDAKNIAIGQDGADNLNVSGGTYIYYGFRRAPGFFDVVAYTGDGVAGRTVTHNLGVTPEMMIVKKRDSVRDWPVYHSSMGGGGYALLNQTTSYPTNGVPWNSTDPTASVFSVGSNTITNGSGGTYIAYLFATVPGISKVGSYSGTGSAVDVDCGFTSGARFVLIKRTDSAASWYLFDTARGIVAGNDPMLNLNSDSAEFTGADYIDPLSSGFTVGTGGGSELNASGGTYIFLAIA